jgi:hypothetical protein
MLQSSTPESRSGTISKAIPPTVCCGIGGSCAVASMPTPSESGAPKRNHSHLAWHPSGHHHRDRVSITYAILNNLTMPA